jgi:lysophospholipase L1-like esterase
VSPRLALPLTLLAFACSAAPAAAQVQAPDEPAGAVRAEQVLVVGDSLAVGMKPFLGELLGADVTWDARTGRTTPEGLQRLRAALRHVTPQAVVISLGTNDGTDPARFTSRLRRVLAAIPAGACVVWADINRPPRKGAFAALNRVLRAEAKRDRRLVVVDWDRAVTSGKVALPDGLHPDAAGFAYRSRLVAAAVQRGCG